MGCRDGGSIEEGWAIQSELERKGLDEKSIAAARKAILNVMKDQKPMIVLDVYQRCRSRYPRHRFRFLQLQTAFLDLLSDGSVKLDRGLLVVVSGV